MSLDHRYDFVLLYDVTDGNPNGDPNADNMPRTDPESGHGIVTDVCLKRKVRNYVSTVRGNTPPYEIYVTDGAVLNKQHQRAVDAEKDNKGEVDRTAWMNKTFYDVRAFGAVMTTGVNAGQVRGPVQLCLSRSIDPITIVEHSITRCAVTTEKEAEKRDKNQTMGVKFTTPYGLYRCSGFVNPFDADKTGFSKEDLDLLWEALINMFALDRSAARGMMVTRALVVFEHESKLGNAHAHRLFNLLKVKRDPVVTAPRSYDDYEVMLASPPDGTKVSCLVLEGGESIRML